MTASVCRIKTTEFSNQMKFCTSNDFYSILPLSSEGESSVALKAFPLQCVQRCNACKKKKKHGLHYDSATVMKAASHLSIYPPPPSASPWTACS